MESLAATGKHLLKRTKLRCVIIILLQYRKKNELIILFVRSKLVTKLPAMIHDFILLISTTAYSV